MQSQYQKFFALERPLHHFCAMQALLEMVPLPLTPCGLGEVRVGGVEERLRIRFLKCLNNVRKLGNPALFIRSYFVYKLNS